MPISEADVNTFVGSLTALFGAPSPQTTKLHSPDGTWDVTLTAAQVPAPASVRVANGRLVLHMGPNFTTWRPNARGWTEADDAGWEASVALPAGTDPTHVTAGVSTVPPYKLTVDLVPRRVATRHGASW